MNSPKINKNNSKERLQKDKVEEFYTRIGLEIGIENRIFKYK